ncbi:MAG: nucleoside deaminase [Bacteroidales bacterium]|nr:nucleoside deaminase [Bacteroidales bacterium]
MDDNYYMNVALNEARFAYEEGEIPVGAIIVCNNQIIAKSHNQTEKLTDCTAHAEILCLTAAFEFLGAKYLPDATMYVTLEPCVMCAGALYWAQIGKLVYAADDLKRGYSLLKENILHPATEVEKGLLKEESENLIRLFFEKLR